MDVHLAEGSPNAVLIRADLKSIEAEAEYLGYLKQRKYTKEEEADADPPKMEPFSVESAQETFDGYGNMAFWLPCEQASLLYSIVEHVPLNKDALAPLLQDVPKRQRESALGVSPSLVRCLQIADLVESFAPLHDNVLSVWRAGGIFSLKLSPLEEIHRYFGSNVAMYFAWMHMFTVWLIIPGIVGGVLSLNEAFSHHTVDDDPFIPFFSLLVVIWSAVFAKYWDRRCSEHAYKWGVSGEDRKERVRPEFRGELRKSVVTGRMERHYPGWKRALAYVLSGVVTALMLAIACFVMVCSLNMQGYIGDELWSERYVHIPPLAKLAEPGAIFDPNQTRYFGLLTYVPTLCHVLVISQLNGLYRSVAEWLTDNENHRLEQGHENAIVLKRFFFEAFDCYIALFYLAFVQFDIAKLRGELVGIYTADSLRRVFTESIMPFISQKLATKRKREELGRQKKERGVGGTVELSPIDEELGKDEYEQFDDYLEMVIEFGYVTLFASAFPPAALLSIICNVVELKSDVWKLTHVARRPTAERTPNIGSWGGVLRSMVYLSVITNAALFAFTSEQMATWLPWLFRAAKESDLAAGMVEALVTSADGSLEQVAKKGRARYVVLSAVLIEHLVMVVVMLINYCISATPEWVRDELNRIDHEAEMAKREAKQLRRKVK